MMNAAENRKVVGLSPLNRIEVPDFQVFEDYDDQSVEDPVS
jgi:hypothetical protein